MVAKKREEQLDLIPAYAIGALDEEERVEFEAWLQHDQEAQLLLAEYQAVADHLVVLAPLRAAPSHLQADLRQRLAASQSYTPVVGSATTSERIRTSLNPRISWVLAAAALVAVVIVGMVLVQVGSDDPDSTDNAEQLFTRLVAQSESGQYSIIPGDVNDTVAGTLIVSSDGRQAVLRVSYLPVIGDDQTFQMWLIDDAGTRTSAGLFQAEQSEETLYIQVPFDRPVTAYQGVGVSLEPAGGSPYDDQPSGPRVLSVPLG